MVNYLIVFYHIFQIKFLTVSSSMLGKDGVPAIESCVQNVEVLSITNRGNGDDDSSDDDDDEDDGGDIDGNIYDDDDDNDDDGGVDDNDNGDDDGDVGYGRDNDNDDDGNYGVDNDDNGDDDDDIAVETVTDIQTLADEIRHSNKPVSLK